MIASQTVLEDKFAESEQDGLEYLLDNAEYEEEIDTILKLLQKCNNCDEIYIKTKESFISTIELK